MRKRGWAVLVAACVVVAVEGGAAVSLPGEPGAKPPLVCEPFPSREYAFVWRNWTVVPQTKLAEVLQTTTGQVERLAADLGLPPQGAIDPAWKTRGYITVIRRNWHLLPYDQLLVLLDLTRDQLRDTLLEDDFLFIKLGSVKPLCEPLRYAVPTPDETAAAGRLARWLREEDVDREATPEEPRFAFVGALAKADPACPVPKPEGDSPFEVRFIFSYFASYGDPLIDPEISSYPEGLLQRLAANGVNGVWLHTVLRTLAKDPAFPEFGAGCEKRIENLKTLVARAKKYGISVYLYLNEPRAVPVPFFESHPERAGMRGVAAAGGSACLCSSSPEVRRWMSDSLTAVFKEVPGLGGVFTITASENPTSCASHRRQAECPRCRERPYADVVAEVNATIAQGVARGNPQAKVFVWDWGWDDASAAEIIAKLPKTCWLMSVSEWALPIERGGVASAVGEYSISAVGPGPRATNHWALARAAGLKTVAKVQVGATWEFCAIPYLPTLDLVAEHAHKLSAAGVNGLMLSWSLGGYPSPNLEVFHSLSERGESAAVVLDRIAERHYGRAAAPLARQAWAAFSDGFREYPYHVSTLYQGPQHMGPANPLYLRPTGYHATMVGLPYDDLTSWRAVYPAKTWIAQMEKVRDGFERGCALYSQMAEREASEKRQDTLRELGLFRAAELHFASCANQARFVMARDKMAASADSVARDECRRELCSVVRAELSVAKQLLPLARRDSRIGYESSNHYFYLPQDLLEKILLCRTLLAELGDKAASPR